MSGPIGWRHRCPTGAAVIPLAGINVSKQRDSSIGGVPSLTGLHADECLIEIDKDVVNVFDADRQPHIAVGDASLRLLL